MIPSQIIEEQPVNRRTRKILVVDDNSYNLLVMEIILSDITEGPDIHTALNGQLAVEKVLLSREESPFNYIFMDLQMPVMDGFQVRKTILTQLSNRLQANSEN